MTLTESEIHVEPWKSKPGRAFLQPRQGLLSLRFGAAAIRALEEGQDGMMVALDPPTVLAVPLEVATERMKCVPLDCDTMLTARDLGINFGDGDGEE